MTFLLDFIEKHLFKLFTAVILAGMFSLGVYIYARLYYPAILMEDPCTEKPAYTLSLFQLEDCLIRLREEYPPIENNVDR